MIKITEQLLPYNKNLPLRNTRNLETVMIHCTELPTLAMAREFGGKILYDDQTGNSGHYYIDRDGAIYRYIQDDRVARHVRGFNDRSIGIEIVNSGRYPNWFFSTSQTPSEKYTESQVETLKLLLKYLKQQYPTLSRIARHSDLDTELIPAEDNPQIQIRRKIDPGPLFPWDDVLAYWQSLD